MSNNWRKVLSWQIQYDVPDDTRHLFDTMVSVKPTAWDEIREWNISTAERDEFRRALLSKPVIDMALDYPLDTLPDNAPRDSEFIMYDTDSNMHYYVYAGGSSYARSMFRIKNWYEIKQT